jgi:hypothetical protein
MEGSLARHLPYDSQIGTNRNLWHIRSQEISIKERNLTSPATVKGEGKFCMPKISNWPVVKEILANASNTNVATMFPCVLR